MQFTDSDPAHTQARARSVLRLTRERAHLTNSDTRVRMAGMSGEHAAVFDAVQGTMSWLDLDGETRRMTLPAGTTAEAVAAMLFGLAHVEDWS